MSSLHAFDRLAVIERRVYRVDGQARKRCYATMPADDEDILRSDARVDIPHQIGIVASFTQVACPSSSSRSLTRRPVSALEVVANASTPREETRQSEPKAEVRLRALRYSRAGYAS